LTHAVLEEPRQQCDSSLMESPALNFEGRLKISPKAEELSAATVNAPFGRSQLPLSSAALGEVKARMLEVAPYSANQAILDRGEHYTVVGKSMTCSVGLRSKRFIPLQDLNREKFAWLLCFTREDFDGVNFAENHVVCAALYVTALSGTPVFLPVLVFGPSEQGDQLNVIRPQHDKSILELVNSPLGASV